MDRSLRSKLRLGDRDFDAHHQYGDLPVEDEELALDAENAKSGAGNPADSRPLQEILDERSSQEKDERRSDGGVWARGHQSNGKLHSDAVPDADLVGVMARAER